MRTSTPIYILKRTAKRLARSESIPWLNALNRVAQQEGFASWSLLQARYRSDSTLSAHQLLSHLHPGNMMLIASRPGFGKTLLSLKMLLTAVKNAGSGYFFSLDFTRPQTEAKLQSLDAAFASYPNLHIDCSDEISSSYIIQQTQHAPSGSFLVVDYLQLLDQKRTNPSLQEQIHELQEHVHNRQHMIVFLSQIDRGFEESNESLPSLDHIRLPNPLDLQAFRSVFFLHEEKQKLVALS